MNRRFNIWLPIIMAIILMTGIQIGTMLNNTGTTSIFSNNNLTTLNEVIDFVKAKYVDTVNLSNLEDGIIANVLEQLDPHSTFIPAKDLKEVNQELQGNFEGVGIEFFIVQDTVMVVSVISGGPSEKAGILAGDRIVTINDTTYAGVSIRDREIINRLRGKSGTTVKVGVKRKGVPALLAFTIERDKIPMYSVDAAYMIDDKTGFIKINRFSETTYDEFSKALKNLKEQGMTQLVLDLRQNGGGILNSATDIVDELLEQQKLMVYTKGRVYSRVDYKTRVMGKFEEGNVAVLIDEGSASASEIVTGAIQDWDRGVVVGRRSFGKGLVQEQYGLSDGSALRLTVAKYYTPSGRCIQKPYDHNLNNYYGEVIDRYNHGEVLEADSMRINDTMHYYTSKGRVVYGGGGIVPDIFVPADTSNIGNPFLNAILNAGLLQQFTYSYFHNHPKLTDGYTDINQFRFNFNISDEIFQAFIAYTAKNGISGTESNIAKAKLFISLRIKAFLAREKFNSTAFYVVINDADPVISKAIGALGKDLNSFTRLVK